MPRPSSKALEGSGTAKEDTAITHGSVPPMAGGDVSQLPPPSEPVSPS